MAEMKGTWTDTARCEGLTMGMKPQLDTFQVHAFFFISNTFISNTRLKMDKSLANFKQNPEAQFLVLVNKQQEFSLKSLP